MITSKWMTAAPEFEMDFSNWQLDVPVEASTFRISAPGDYVQASSFEALQPTYEKCRNRNEEIIMARRTTYLLSALLVAIFMSGGELSVAATDAGLRAHIGFTSASADEDRRVARRTARRTTRRNT